MANTLVYELDNKIYINLTNRCSNECVFCIRNDKDDVCGADLRLDNEDFTAQDVIAQLKQSDEIVFCGYGEPTMKLALLKEVARYIKENYPGVNIRLNTNGHGNVINKRDIVPELKGLVDEISVSLNASDAAQYEELSRPKIKNAYETVLDFIKSSAVSGIKTTASVVNGYKGVYIDLEACEKAAAGLGAGFRVREWIPNGY